MGLAADEFQARRTGRDGKAETVFFLFLGIGAQGPVHRAKDLVGEGRQGGQLLGAPDNDPFRSGVHDPQGDVGVGQLADLHTSVDLGMAKGVGHAKVVLTNVLMIGDKILPVLGVFPAVKRRHLAHGRELDVDVVRGAPQHPVGSVGDDLQRPAPAQQVIFGLWDNERQGDRLAAGGRIEYHILAVFRVVLQVVDRGQGLGHSRQLGMGGHVLHPLAFQPDLPVILQTFQELGPGANCHDPLPLPGSDRRPGDSAHSSTGYGRQQGIPLPGGAVAYGWRASGVGQSHGCFTRKLPSSRLAMSEINLYTSE